VRNNNLENGFQAYKYGIQESTLKKKYISIYFTHIWYLNLHYFILHKFNDKIVQLVYDTDGDYTT